MRSRKLTDITTGVVAAIRTGVAALVGFIIAALAANGFDLPEEFAANLTAVLFVVATGLYNLVVVWLEKNVSPKFGILLGIPKTPTYENTPK